MYLSTPCPRPSCGQPTLNQPEQHGSILLSRCDSCGRHARYHIRNKIGGELTYEVSVFGGDAERTKIITTRIPVHGEQEIRNGIKKLVYKWKKEHE